MAQRKFTVILLPDEGGYHVVFPDYPGCVTQGSTVEQALDMAKEAMELYLEVEAEQGGDPVPEHVHVSHVVVGEVAVEVPDSLIEIEETARAGQPGP